jgi:hypothetical protein
LPAGRMHLGDHLPPRRRSRSAVRGHDVTSSRGWWKRFSMESTAGGPSAHHRPSVDVPRLAGDVVARR